MKKGVNGRINGNILQWFGHVVRKNENPLVEWMDKNEFCSESASWETKEKVE